MAGKWERIEPVAAEEVVRKLSWIEERGVSDLPKPH